MIDLGRGLRGTRVGILKRGASIVALGFSHALGCSHLRRGKTGNLDRNRANRPADGTEGISHVLCRCFRGRDHVFQALEELFLTALRKVCFHQPNACGAIPLPGFDPAFENDLFALGLEIGECLRPGRLAKQSDLLFERADRLAQELRGGKGACSLFPGFTGFENGNARFVGRRLECGHGDFHPLYLDRCLADLGGLEREIGGKVPGGLKRAFGFSFLRALGAAGTVSAVAADLFSLGGKPSLCSSDAVLAPPR